MSKRKSLSQSMLVSSSDIHFEDDEDQSSIAGDSAKGSRVSHRAKKAKEIYDPSEHNGPVHKRKKEALEKEAEKLKTPTKIVKHTTGSSKQLSAEVIKPTIDALSEQMKSKSPVKATAEAAKAVKSADTKKRSLSLFKVVDKPVSTRKEDPAPTAFVVKEPSKRIQARKLSKVQNHEKGRPRAKKQHRDSISDSLSTEDFEEKASTASTVELKNHVKNSSTIPHSIPDVRKWNEQRVFEYFSKTLGYKQEDASVFVEQEIDGEALMIMKRSDIVNTKFQNLKLGVALKMWTHISQFQTGSSDPSQTWK